MPMRSFEGRWLMHEQVSSIKIGVAHKAVFLLDDLMKLA